MQLTLPPDLEAFIREEVSSGRYPSTDEVVRDAITLLRDTVRVDEAWRDELNTKIDVGLAQLARGEGIPGEEWYRRAKARMAALNVKS